MLSRIFLAFVLALAPLPAAFALENTAPPVPQGLVSFSSDESLARLSRSDVRVNFPALANQFEAEYVGAFCGPASATNYLIDLKHAVIMDVEATTAIRQAEVGAAKTMLDRTAEQFGLTPSRLVADGGYGSAEMVGWLVDERGIEPQVKLMDKSERSGRFFERMIE